MQKLRIYIDTSVISNIDAPHVPEFEAATLELFRLVKEKPNEYELLVSPITDYELGNCPEPKRSRLYAFLESVNFTKIPASREAEELANLYVERGVLSEKHIRDLQHIAYAVVARCDCIVSWNFKHFVKVQTIQRVNAVNFECHYANALIVMPYAIIGEGK